MKEKILINAISRWNGTMVDRATGEKITGTPYTKLFFTSSTESVSDNKRGLFEANYKGEFNLYEKFNGHKFPVEVELDITIRPGAKGAAEVWVLNATPLLPSAKVS